MTVEFGWNEIEIQKDQIEVQYLLPEEATAPRKIPLGSLTKSKATIERIDPTCRIDDMSPLNEFPKRTVGCFVTELQQRREVDDLAIEQTGNKPRHHTLFRASNADDFEKLPLRLYLSGSVMTIRARELNIFERS